MHMLKRLTPSELRQQTPAGRKVMYVWDRAGIDFRQWYTWKQGSGIYMVSREKENMALETIAELPFDGCDPRNSGVLSNEIMATSQGVSVRRVRFKDPSSGEDYSYITSEMDLPPGIIAWLYRRRWDIEKIFDETKNRISESKSWASSLQAKKIQGLFIAMTYNLILIMQRRLLDERQMPRDEKEERRRNKRHAHAIDDALEKGIIPSLIYQSPCKPTQVGCKFIRWVRTALQRRLEYDEAVELLTNTIAFF